MTKRKRRPKKFSITKAVKANARKRVGQPKAERVIDDSPRRERHERKHKKTLTDLLQSGQE